MYPCKGIQNMSRGTFDSYINLTEIDNELCEFVRPDETISLFVQPRHITYSLFLQALSHVDEYFSSGPHSRYDRIRAVVDFRSLTNNFSMESMNVTTKYSDLPYTPHPHYITTYPRWITFGLL